MFLKIYLIQLSISHSNRRMTLTLMTKMIHIHKKNNVKNEHIHSYFHNHKVFKLWKSKKIFLFLISSSKKGEFHYISGHKKLFLKQFPCGIISGWVHHRNKYCWIKCACQEEFEEWENESYFFMILSLFFSSTEKSHAF